MLKKTSNLLFLSVAALLFYLISLYSIQDKLIFHPDKFYVGPESAGVSEFEENPFVSFGGQMNMGWYYQGKKDKPLILFFHGNAGQLATFAPKLKMYLEEGYSVFMPEYRGFGSTKGKLDEDTMYADAIAAFDFVQEKYNPKQIVVFGYSMGTAPASALAEMRKPDAVVLAAPFYSLEREVEDKKVPLSKYVLKNRLKSYKYISKYEGKLLIIHGDKDTLIKPEHGKDLFEISPSKEKQFILAEGVDHNYLFFNEENHQHIMDWLKQKFE